MLCEGAARITSNQGVLIYFDLDNVKPVNDQYSHDYGDWLLKETARRIQLIMRKNDLICQAAEERHSYPKGDGYLITYPHLFPSPNS